MSNVYKPSNQIINKLKRRLVRFEGRRMRPVELDQPIVSFTFDDCPKSVINNALKPLESEGWLSTIYIAMGLCNITNHLGLHMSAGDVKAVHASGHEIADHTFSHCDAYEHSLGYVLDDIDKNQSALADLGIPPSESFAYPYGQVTKTLKKALGKRFKGARGIRSNSHTSAVDMNQIGSNRLYSGDDFDVLLSQIKTLKDNPGWMTIFSHDVRENPSEFGCTPEQMLTIIEAVKDCGAQVMPVASAIDQLEVAHG